MEKTKKQKKDEEKIGQPRRVKIKIGDIRDHLIQRIINQYGVEWNDVKCLTKERNIVFEIPGLDDTLCNDIMPAITMGDHSEVIDGCGSTTGGCLCGKKKGHKGYHKCKRCGQEWEVQDNDKIREKRINQKGGVHNNVTQK